MVRRLTVRELLEVVADMPEKIRYDYGHRAFALSGYIFRELLGGVWLDRYLHWDSKHAGMLKLPQPGATGITRQAFWTWELAETLFNLRHVPGFKYVVSDMRRAADDTKVQATFAELDFGRLLKLHRLSFRYRKARGRTQDDYDLELRLPDGTLIAADAKCKLEGTDVRISGLRNVLRKGYTKLPEGRPCMLFVKMPQHWLEHPDIKRNLIPETGDFVRGVSRLVSVIYFVPYLDFNGGLESQLRFIEIPNDRNAFDQNRDWQLFKDQPVPVDDWHSYPRSWTRLLGFPDGFPRRIWAPTPGGGDMTEAEIARRTDPVLKRLLKPRRRRHLVRRGSRVGSSPGTGSPALTSTN